MELAHWTIASETTFEWPLRRYIAALGESTRKDIAALNERMTKVEGLFEGFTKSSPQSTASVTQIGVELVDSKTLPDHN